MNFQVAYGDQPADIENQITGLIKSYIENERSIILAFAPGNTDLETNDSIKLALQVDPEGKRTLVVVTKMDMIGAGKEVLFVQFIDYLDHLQTRCETYDVQIFFSLVVRIV